ncbi:hypothetical protein SAMD00019534_088580 [Acytostelium subglobosum LB1]|uniref:hypothetical protein n=1 Tax=Acytostelium subglobosum LB1 TaxID=1410327 RepID=UPI000644E1DA|nr:hypothetical protein SAMD00019534_088580 [Acytostelium subglobosum LB1]GAM25683.1 hypothetical protein SAMD00019534_088580 [Acytostelium subglobosum LB1]|eukprot:XP_012751201.1 hypothetical protein SAMD00019534_088580 [Acytostelium subglobosum LB1]
MSSSTIKHHHDHDHSKLSLGNAKKDQYDTNTPSAIGEEEDANKVINEAFKKTYAGKIAIFEKLLRNEKQQIVDMLTGQQINYGALIKGVLETALSCIPYVGGLLSTLTDIIWSLFSSKAVVNMMQEIKDMVSQMIDEKLEKYDQSNIQSDFDGVKLQLKDLNQQMDILAKYMNSPDVKSYQKSVYDYFIDLLEAVKRGLVKCQRPGYEMVIGNAKDWAVPQGIIDGFVANFKEYLPIYTKYATDVFNKQYTAIINNKNIGNSIEIWKKKNEYYNQMVGLVFDIVHLFPFLDRAQYPGGVTRDAVHVLFTDLCGWIIDPNVLSNLIPSSQVQYIDDKIFNNGYQRYKGDLTCIEGGINSHKVSDLKIFAGARCQYNGIPDHYEGPEDRNNADWTNWNMDFTPTEAYLWSDRSMVGARVTGSGNKVINIGWSVPWEGIHATEHHFKIDKHVVYGVLGFDCIKMEEDSIPYYTLLAGVNSWIPESLKSLNQIWPKSATVIDPQKFSKCTGFEFKPNYHGPGFHGVALKPGAEISFKYSPAVVREGRQRHMPLQTEFFIECSSPNGASSFRMTNTEEGFKSFQVPAGSDTYTQQCANRYVLMPEESSNEGDQNQVSFMNNGNFDIILRALVFKPVQ